MSMSLRNLLCRNGEIYGYLFICLFFACKRLNTRWRVPVINDNVIKTSTIFEQRIVGKDKIVETS